MSRTLTIPDHLYTRLTDEARSQGLASVEEWLQSLAGSLPGRGRRQGPAVDRAADRPVVGHALDEFIGDWSEAEAEEFLGEVAVFEQIDESLWR